MIKPTQNDLFVLRNIRRALPCLLLAALLIWENLIFADGLVREAKFFTLPLITKSSSGEQCVAAAVIDSDGLKKARLELSSPKWNQSVTKILGELAKGKQSIEMELPAFEEAMEVKAVLTWEGGSQEWKSVNLLPPKKWTVYLTQHTHTDIGYTRPQTEILPEHLRYIDYALDYCDLTDSYPEDAKFRWTCETGWAVREYLERRPPRQIARLKKRIQEGRIEVAAMLLNMAEVANESNLAALLQQISLFRDQLGAPVRTALQNDVNGAGWCLVDFFQDIGVRYLSMGINKTRSLLPFDKPTAFWWESPSGKRTLAYRSDHYMTANFWHLEQGKLDSTKPELLNYLKSLEDRNYPYDRIGVQFSGYFTDNSPPSTAACDVVKEWNQRFAWPQLRISTAHEFLEYVEKEHGPSLAVHRQAWPDWWTDGFGSAARETGAFLDTQSVLQISQGLMSMASLLGAPIRSGALDRIQDIQDDLLFYAEHTYGAAESIDDPMAENTQVQWGEKGSYVWSAVKNSNLLREEAFGLIQEYLPRGAQAMVAVFNTLNWPRTGLVRVFIDHEILPKDKESRFVDPETDKTIPAQIVSSRAEGSYWALWVEGIPPFGYKAFRVESSDQPRPATTEGSLKDNTLENRYYRLTIDPEKGAIQSLYDKELETEWVDARSDWGLGQCVYETMTGKREPMTPSAYQRVAWRNLKLKAAAQGPVWHSVILQGDMDGCSTNRGVSCEIRLYDQEKRLEFHYTIRKEPITRPEAVYVAFPFHQPDFQIVYEGQGGLVIPGKTQIPGSASDWQTLQNFAAIRSAKGQLIWGSPEVPLVQLGDFNLGKWMPITRVDRAHIYSWVMNNYWFTNFRAEQEGEFKWSYYLTSTKDTANMTATRFGWGSRLPLTARVLPPDKSGKHNRPSVLSTLTAQVPNVLCIEARPAARENGVVLHLREVEGRATTITPEMLQFQVDIVRADEVNVLEETLRENAESVTLKPYEVKFVRVVLRP